MEILVAAAVALFVPLSIYIALRVRGRNAWGVVHDGYATQGAGVYRNVAVPTWKRGEPPFVVRVASFTSLVLGLMVVPGALATLLGLLVLVEVTRFSGDGVVLIGVLLLSAPTGLTVAVKLLNAGQALARRTPGALTATRSAARWALWHNAGLVAALAVVPFVEASLDGIVVAVVVMCCLYAAVSITHALLLRSAARALEAYDAAQAADPAPADPANTAAPA